MSRFDSILLGDNPFFGVDHLSQERARKKASTSQNLHNALQIIDYSYKLGVRGMVVSTHPTLKDLIYLIKTESDLIDKIEFYPILPYAQGYVLKINEMGLLNTIMDTLSPAGIVNKMKIITSGSLGMIKKDLFKLFQTFIDIELLQLTNVRINTVFLHDVVTDLALALNMKQVFQVFQEHLSNRNINAGLVTKNFPLLVSKLNEWDLDYKYIMTSFNKAGFQMNPSKQECENALNIYKGNVIAMSILAGGFVSLQDAYEYILVQPKIRNLVIGLSSIQHAKDTFGIFLNKTNP